MNRGRSTFALVLAIGALAVMPGSAAAQANTLTTCPGTYQVLTTDTIGKLKLAAGAYYITVLNPANLSCAKATQNFGEFLQDYDGKLRRPWIYDTSSQTFVRGKGSPIGFFVSRAGPVSGGGSACPGTFQVLHNDHIGKLTVNKGSYRITLLNANSPDVLAGEQEPLRVPAGLRRRPAPPVDHRFADDGDLHARKGLDNRIPHQARHEQDLGRRQRHGRGRVPGHLPRGEQHPDRHRSSSRPVRT